MISLDLMKSSEVRKAGDRANYLIITYHYFARLVERFEKSTPYSRSNRRVTQRYLLSTYSSNNRMNQNSDTLYSRAVPK